MNSARQNILARLKASQDKRGEIGENIPDFTSPVYHPLNDSLSQEFKTNLELIGGEVFLLPKKSDVSGKIQQICHEKSQNKLFCFDPSLRSFIPDDIETRFEEIDFQELNIGLTSCEYLVAHLGSVLISSAQISGRRLNVFPETHLVVAHKSQLTGYLDEALKKLTEKYKNKLPSLISNITGPSRTADIEKTLVMGMHGPKSLIVIITEEPI
ncbi:MAG: lactate utilization protein [Prolixibacteraceae bacterium]